MAARDIMPWRSSDDEERLAFPVAATQTFLEGEPLVLTAGGALNEAASDPAAIIGIAAVPAIVNTFTGASAATGTMLSVYGTADSNVFISSNFIASAIFGAVTVPTQANAIGALAGLTLAGGIWSVSASALNLICIIDDVLDARRNSITNPNILTTAGVNVLFRFV